MNRKSIITLLKASLAALLLFTLLFAGGRLQSSPQFIGSVLREITAVILDSQTQWMIFLCLGSYFTAFFFIHSHAENRLTQRCKSGMANWWLAYVLFITAILYAIDYLPSTQALTLLAGAVIGCGMAFLVCFENQSSQLNLLSCFVNLIILLLAVASVWNMDSAHTYEYHTHARWSGPWDNPNIFGLLMGSGLALAVGLGIGRWKTMSGVRLLTAGRFATASWCFLAAIFMGRGLLHSYSRGAWLATICGGVYLIVSWLWRLRSEIVTKQSPGLLRSLRTNGLSLALILVATGTLCFWHFRQSDWHPVRRAFSAARTEDFSSRNRVAAWEGDLQMMAERPWFGSGWNQPEPLYEHYYLPPKMSESAAIEMNDYLILGSTLGIPALFCFGMYLWLSLTRKLEVTEANWLQTACRAGAIVLLVGFWFDGGLFKLPTAATFWILLELGSIQLRKDASKELDEAL